VSQSSDPSDQDIPLLTDVMVTGHEPHARTKRPKRSGGHGHESSHGRRHAKGHEASHELTEDTAAHAGPPEPTVHDDDVPVLDSLYEPVHEPMHEPVAGRREPSLRTDHPPIAAPAPLPAREPAQFVPGEAEFTSGSTAERYVAPPESGSAAMHPEHAHPTAAASDYDADMLAERLRGRFSTYLNGDGRNLIEARCRDAFQDHTTWLVNQITREVALALETEMLRWVREAIREELGNATTSK
jgi:hypothetical protein